jgi:hypothetical protein
MTKQDLQATIAATHPFPFVFEVAGGSPRQGATWDELPKTTQSVVPEETLREVLRKAARSLGVTISREAARTDRELRERDGRTSRSADAADWLVFFGFHQDDDDDVIVERDGIPIRNWNTRIHRRVVVVRDAGGAAVWKRPPFDATVAELMDAHSIGLIEGDPLQIYLVPSIPQGAFGLGGEWNLFVEHLKTLWNATSAASTLGGAAAAGFLLKELIERRGKRATEAISRRSTAWTERGGAPGDLVNLLAAKPRTTEDIAGLLGCTGDEAEAILWALGFAFNEDSRTWIQGGDETAQLIEDDIELSFTDVLEWPEAEGLYREAVEKRLRDVREGRKPLPAAEERKTMRDRYFKRRNGR